MHFHISAVTDIDTSGIHAFEELLKTLKKRGIQVSRTSSVYSKIVHRLMY
jgi:anti-anti-sigma regulatory factor